MTVKFLTIEKVLPELDELEDRDESHYTELTFENILTMTDNAVLFRFHPREFHKSSGFLTDVWFPKKALRQLDGSIYFSINVAKSKEMRV